MALRRPRLKASANLCSKRKVKKEADEGPSDEIRKELELPVKKEETPKCREPQLKPEPIPITLGSPECKPQISDKTEFQERAPAVQPDHDFKCPQLKEKPPETTTAVVAFTIQDVEQSLGSPQHYSRHSSPVKPRQRIRPMPYFATRRNSIQGGNAESEDETKRHKTSSVVVHSPLPIDTKIHPLSTNRKRTESSCSNVSESNFSRDARARRVFATEESQRISVAKKEFQSKFNGKTPEKSLLKMFDFIYYNPTSNPMKQRSKPDGEEIKEAERVEEVHLDNSVEKTPEVAETDNAPQEQEDTESSMPVPQLKLGPNGELVVDEKSLVIETAAEKDARATLANSSVIYVDENTENNGFYKRQKRTKDWTSDETIKFYRCLHTVGTDFSLMLTLFPNRTRRDLKLKFKKEERTNLNLVNKALLYPKMFDIEELKRDLEKDEKVAAEKQKKWEEIKKKNMPQKLKEAIKVKPNSKTRNKHKSKVSRSMRSGEIVYENENLIKDCTSKSENVGHELPIEQEAAIQDVEEDGNEQTLFDILLDSDTSTVASFQSNTIVKRDCEIIDVFESANNEIQEIDEAMDDYSDSHNDEALEDPDMANQFLSDVNCVLREIANGSLVVVSSEDPNSKKTINEIYVICKETGELSDEPLDLPDDVMQCIFSAIQT